MRLYEGCPNCGETNSICDCTWDEMSEAKGILRRRNARQRKKEGRQTIIEEEEEKRKLRHRRQ